MPHTSHRKKKGTQNKRQEILEADGWTRVSSNDRFKSLKHEAGEALDANGHHPSDDLHPALVPMRPVEGSTVDSMQAQFDKFEAKWLETELCSTLKDTLTGHILTAAPKISTCVVLGTGSFCGDAVHWVGRHEAAYFQLAAFKTIIRAIEEVQGQSVHAYAQEPRYNDLDAELLQSLGITTTEHPQGFHLLDEHSCAYSPNAELVVEQQILARDPQIWLHRDFRHQFYEYSDLDDDEKMAEDFQKTHTNVRLPHLDLRDFPFHGSLLWWRQNGLEVD